MAGLIHAGLSQRRRLLLLLGVQGLPMVRLVPEPPMRKSSLVNVPASDKAFERFIYAGPQQLLLLGVQGLPMVRLVPEQPPVGKSSLVNV